MKTTENKTHTPGPWKFDPNSLNCEDHADCNRGCIRGGAEDWILAEMCHDCDGYEANARLIAAAPEMLGALMQILKYAEHSVCVGDDCARCAIGGLAERTIRKAKGQL